MGESHGEDYIDFDKFKERMLKSQEQTAELEEGELQKKFKEIDELRLGPSGKFPPEKLSAKDEGQIKFSVGLSMDKKRVVINFGKKVRWVGMNRNQAIDVGKAIVRTAKEVIE